MRLLLLVVVHGEGRAGMIRDRRRVLLVLLVELRVHVVVLLVVVLEVGLQVLRLMLMIGVEVLRVGRRDRVLVLARDAAGGSLRPVDERGHHGAGERGMELGERPVCGSRV